MLSEWRSVIAVSLSVGSGVRLIKLAMHVHAKHYKHNEDGRTAPGVCGNGSIPLSHSGNFVTRIGIHTHTLVTLYQGAVGISGPAYPNRLYIYLVEPIPLLSFPQPSSDLKKVPFNC